MRRPTSAGILLPCERAPSCRASYGLLTNDVETPFELVSVTVTAITSVGGPFEVVKGTVSINSLPVALDAGFEYQVANAVLSGTVTVVVASVALLEGAN
jgi:hypothetical protein